MKCPKTELRSPCECSAQAHVPSKHAGQPGPAAQRSPSPPRASVYKWLPRFPVFCLVLFCFGGGAGGEEGTLDP